MNGSRGDGRLLRWVEGWGSWWRHSRAWWWWWRISRAVGRVCSRAGDGAGWVGNVIVGAGVVGGF